MKMSQRAKADPVVGAVVTELRVHGVGGETPESLLEVPITELVAGDETAGFFQPPSWIATGRARKEAYSWGGITSANRIRALWILLLPFALVNVAGWMFSHEGQASDSAVRVPTTGERRKIYVLRVFGLLVTVTYAAVIVSVFVGIVADSCRTSCSEVWYLGPWRMVGSHSAGVALSSLLAAVAVLAIAYLTKRSQSETDADLGKKVEDPAFVQNLRSGSLWNSAHVAHRLGILHTAVAVATVGFFSAIYSQGAISNGHQVSTLLVVLGAAWLLRDVVAVSVQWIWALLVYAGLATLSVVVAVALSTSIPSGAAMRSGFLGLAASVVLLTLILWYLSARGAEQALPMRFSVPLFAILVTTAVGAGVSISVGRLIGVRILLEELEAVAVGAVVWLATAFAIALVKWRTAPADSRAAIAVRYGVTLSEASPRDTRFVSKIRKAQRISAVTDAAASVMRGSAAASLVAALVFIFVPPPAWLVTLGTRAVTGLPFLLMYWIQSSWRDRDFRKQLAVVWDVLTFWPRWYHPWAPPSYGEKAVPHLRSRVDMLTSEGGRVIISAHSQGTVVALAALADCQHRPDVRLLTHGSPLTRLYERYFPEYFDGALFGEVAVALGDGATWINLWRNTDYIGGPISNAEYVENTFLPDPESSESILSTDDRPKPSSHSDYFGTATYRSVLDRLIDES